MVDFELLIFDVRSQISSLRDSQPPDWINMGGMLLKLSAKIGDT